MYLIIVAIIFKKERHMWEIFLGLSASGIIVSKNNYDIQ